MPPPCTGPPRSDTLSYSKQVPTSDNTISTTYTQAQGLDQQLTCYTLTIIWRKLHIISHTFNLQVCHFTQKKNMFVENCKVNAINKTCITICWAFMNSNAQLHTWGLSCVWCSMSCHLDTMTRLLSANFTCYGHYYHYCRGILDPADW